jgi:SAM-dependent methyltransferase
MKTLDQKVDLSIRMQNFYRNNEIYHGEIGEISGDRPSDEEKQLFNSIERCLPPGIDRQNLKILEVGCGSCDSASGFLKILGANPKNYFGIDAAIPAIVLAQTKYPEYHLCSGNAIALPFDDAQFDITFFNYVLEHMVYPDQLLQEASRVTKKGGIVAMIVPVADLPWLVPSSLRDRRNQRQFLLGYTWARWIEFCKIRYQKNFYAFNLVTKPIVLSAALLPDYKFEPDDDLVYNGSSFEIKKYLQSLGHQILEFQGRSITPCIQNGQRPIVDIARIIIFAILRLSLGKFSAAEFTTTALITSRK